MEAMRLDREEQEQQQVLQDQEQYDHSRRRLRQEPKRIRPSYKEQDLTDTDDYMTEEEGEEDGKSGSTNGPAKKKARLSQHSDGVSLAAEAAAASASFGSSVNALPGAAAATITPGTAEGSAAVPVAGVTATAIPALGPLIEGPPEGALSTLWYSREVFLNIFVLEKVVGWKTRPVVQLEALATVDDDEAASAGTYTLDVQEASALQQRILAKESFWNEPRKRMEVSRINPSKCPVVMALAVAQEEADCAKAATAPSSEDVSTGSITGFSRKPARFRLHVKQDFEAAKVGTLAREEVLLVKWRGRSHLHCSWERASDIERLDHSNNTARNKIRRYYQSQEIALGPNWKKALEEDRSTAAKIHAHGAAAGAEPPNGAEEATSTNLLGEEYFPVQCLEIELILACDENEMNMNVLAAQRAKNMASEQESLKLREETSDADDKKDDSVAPVADLSDRAKTARSLHKMILGLVRVPKAGVAISTEEPWDPEDNVRYVVKWKGVPYAEMTWEYWRDIKRDAVDQAEDFWYRNSPQLDKLRGSAAMSHPNIRDFKKLQESPTYGVSSRKRPVASLDGDAVMEDVDNRGGADDDAGAFKGFQLRSYQLEGVNWLLFNWWNKRSCILADEMGAGTCSKYLYCLL